MITHRAILGFPAKSCFVIIVIKRGNLMETPQIFLWLLDAAAQLKLWRSPAASSVFSLGLPEYLFKRTVRSPLDHKLVTPVTRLRYALSDILPLCWISHVYGNDSNRKVHFSSCFTPSLADVFYIIHFSQLHLHVCCTICGLGPALGLHWLLPPHIQRIGFHVLDAWPPSKWDFVQCQKWSYKHLR